MEFNGFIFKDHEPYSCFVKTNVIIKINDEWYSVTITEEITFKSGYFKFSESEQEEHGFETYTPNKDQKDIFLKSGTIICIEANTKSDKCHYSVTRNGIKEEKKELIFQFKLP